LSADHEKNAGQKQNCKSLYLAMLYEQVKLFSGTNPASGQRYGPPISIMSGV